jgi:hypothetical protein
VQSRLTGARFGEMDLALLFSSREFPGQGVLAVLNQGGTVGVLFSDWAHDKPLDVHNASQSLLTCAEEIVYIDYTTLLNVVYPSRTDYILSSGPSQ